MNSATGETPDNNSAVIVVPAICDEPVTDIVLSSLTARALHLHHAGYSVSFLYGGVTNDTQVDLFGHQFPIAPLASDLLPPSNGPMSPVMFDSRRVCETLRRFPAPALLITTSLKGLLYYALCAKRQGLAFTGTTCEIVVAETTAQIHASEGTFSDSTGTTIVSWVERESLQLCNRLISPAPAVSHWLQQYCPKSVEIQDAEHRFPTPLATPLATPMTTPLAPGTTEDRHTPQNELVLVGGISRRNGAMLLARALEQFPHCFDGLTTTFHSFASRDQELLVPLRRGLPSNLTITETPATIPSLIRYLRQPGRIAITLPDADCPNWFIPLAHEFNISTLTTDHPYVREHFDGASIRLVEQQPEQIARTIEQLVESGLDGPVAGVAQRRSISTVTEHRTRLKPAITPDKISVCIAHYCRPHLLARALESLAQQSVSGFDVIVVDDGSPDQHQAALTSTVQQYQDRLDLQLIRQTNQYLGATRNTGWRASGRDYVLFMDDDNIALEKEIEIFAIAAANSGADILSCFSDTFNEGSDTQQQPQPLNRITPIGACLSIGANFNTFGDSNSFWKTSVLQQIGGFTELKGVGKEDNEIFARAVLRGFSLSVVPEPLFLYQLSHDRMRHHHRNPEASTHHVLRTFAVNGGEHTGDMANLLYGQAKEIQRLQRELNLAKQCLSRAQSRLDIVEKLIGAEQLENA